MNVFLSCVKTKRNVTCKAEDMYISDLFKKSLAYAKSLKAEKIYILSAKYGLLELNEIIKPYNETLVGANEEKCKKWAGMVYQQMKKKGVNFEKETLFLCGKNYRKYLITKFPKGKAPLKNLGIGKQLAFYSNELKK